MKKLDRQYLTAISVSRGIINLIGPEGDIETYRQRGIDRLNPEDRQMMIAAGILDKRVMYFKVLPYHYSIEFEDPDIMGRAKASFSLPKIR